MPLKGAAKQKTSVAISAEARRLLALMAERSGISQSAVLELAIRERAKREKVELSSGALASAAITPEQQIAARERTSAPARLVAHFLGGRFELVTSEPLLAEVTELEGSIG
jgi:hypothetical protein